MRLASFTMLTTLALVYAALTLVETVVYQKWDHQTLQQRNIQIELAYFQRRGNFIDQLIRRVAVDSQRDPALVELLKERHIRVVMPTAEQMRDSSSTESTPSTETPAAASGKSAPIQPSTTSPTP